MIILHGDIYSFLLLMWLSLQCNGFARTLHFLHRPAPPLEQQILKNFRKHIISVYHFKLKCVGTFFTLQFFKGNSRIFGLSMIECENRTFHDTP